MAESGTQSDGGKLTPRRLSEARQRGQVARSADLTAAAAVLAGFGALAVVAGPLLEALTNMTAFLLAAQPIGAGPAEGLWASAAPALLLAACVPAASLLAGLLANLAQVGFLATVEPIRPDFSRLSPAAGLRQVFSIRAGARTLGTLLKLAAVTGVAVHTLRGEFARIASPIIGPAALAARVGSATWRVGVRIGVVLLALAAADYLYQRWQHRRDLSVSASQARDELRRTEGDTGVRRHRRSRRVKGKVAPVAPGEASND